ncbi:hypothetical protein ALC53_08786 [Atta colombica]|uniref:Uncharacterized protein n=1 Tax=Atta colombica TaxID=520822 RepID=A0A195B980_9HYME|nr:hypothetical protein ALC53_08786 [Atta colombica]
MANDDMDQDRLTRIDITAIIVVVVVVYLDRPDGTLEPRRGAYGKRLAVCSSFHTASNPECSRALERGWKNAKGFCGLSLYRNPLLTFHESCCSLYSKRGAHRYVSVNSKVHETLPLAMDYDMAITRKPFGTFEHFCIEVLFLA